MIFIYTLDPCLDKPSSGRCPPKPYGSRCRDSQSDILWRERLIGDICQVLLIRESLAREAGKILGVKEMRTPGEHGPLNQLNGTYMHSQKLKHKVQGLQGSAPCPLHKFWLLS